MDRTRFGRRLALAGTAAMLVALVLQAVADPSVDLREEAFLHATTGSRPYAVALYHVDPGQTLDVTGVVVTDGGSPFRVTAIESADLQRFLQGETVPEYPNNAAFYSITVTRSREAHEDQSLAVIWVAERTLQPEQRAAFDQTVTCISRGDCAILAHVGSTGGEVIQLVGWALGGLALASIAVGIFLWRPWTVRVGEAPDGEPSDLVALFDRSRSYVMQLRRNATLSLVALALLMASAVVLAWFLVEDLERRANIPVYAWVLLGALALFVVPGLTAWTVWRAARREERRLQALDDARPL